MANTNTDEDLASEFLDRLTETIASRKNQSPNSSYVAGLLDQGLESILKKVGEESTETVLAAMSGDREHVLRETADLWFHSLVMLASMDLDYRQVLAELKRREGVSGLSEKAGRSQDGS